MESGKQEHPSTYIIENRSNEAELARLQIQDQMITNGMGGVLPEQSNLESIKRVLDIGCGTGDWLIETAKTYPGISQLVGIDVSLSMVKAAREQVRQQGMDNRVEFHVMDALRMLEFPPQFFDLINLRLGGSFLRTWDWPKLLEEFQRVSQPNGIIRVTDVEFIRDSTSPTFNALWEQFQGAMFASGHLFDPTPGGVSDHLEGAMHQAGVLKIQKQSSLLHFQAGTPEWRAFVEDMQYTFRTLKPFISKWGCASSNYDEIYNQALIEMQRTDFEATWPFLTVWGRRSPTYSTAKER